MSHFPKKIELENHGLTAILDRSKNHLRFLERGGWPRSYDAEFNELAKLAKKWSVPFSDEMNDADLIETGRRLIFAEEAIAHDLSPNEYFPNAKKISEADFRKLNAFETLIQKWGAERLLDSMAPEAREALMSALSQQES